jgi:hypothetical protein
MPVTPTGRLSVPLDQAANWFANSTQFQIWTGTGSVGAAKARVYIAVVDAVSEVRPWARVGWVPGSIRTVNTRGPYASGVILVEFLATVSSANQLSHQDATYEFLNSIDAIMQDAESYARTNTAADTLLMDHWVLAALGRGTEEVKVGEGDYFFAHYHVHYGLRM